MMANEGAKIALVTGANRGIGYAIVRGLAERGFITLLGSRDPAKGEASAAQLRSEGVEKDGGAIHPIAVDVSDLASVDAAAANIRSTYGRLDVLVNNAAVYLDEYKPIMDVPLEDVYKTIETNFYGALYTCRAFIPMMRAQNYGRIVNVSSESGVADDLAMSTPFYALSKLILNGFTRILAHELKNERMIKINAMCPGWVATDMGGSNATRTPEQGADTALWLATLPDDGESGGFFQYRRAIKW